MFRTVQLPVVICDHARCPHTNTHLLIILIVHKKKKETKLYSMTEYSYYLNSLNVEKKKNKKLCEKRKKKFVMFIEQNACMAILLEQY